MLTIDKNELLKIIENTENFKISVEKPDFKRFLSENFTPTYLNDRLADTLFKHNKKFKSTKFLKGSNINKLLNEKFNEMLEDESFYTVEEFDKALSNIKKSFKPGVKLEYVKVF